MGDKLRIGLIGSTGRMGIAIAGLVAASPSFEIAASFHRRKEAEPLNSIDLFLDVSSPEALPRNIDAACVAKKPLVIGTTGHLSLTPFQEASKRIPIFYSPNFSLGMALLRHAASELARKFHRSAAIDLIETHHAAKKDAPSGSARLLVQTIEELHPSPVTIHSIRSGTIAGEHTLLFNTAEERLILTHEVHNRSAFALGALAAACFLVGQSPGLYGMDDLLSLSKSQQ